MASWEDGNYCGTYWDRQLRCGKDGLGRAKSCNIPKTCWHWPDNGSLVKCTDNNKIYKYNSSNKKLYLLPNQDFRNENNKMWSANNGNSKCTDSNWGSQTNLNNRQVMKPLSSATEGTSIKCYQTNVDSRYRWTYGNLMDYNNSYEIISWNGGSLGSTVVTDYYDCSNISSAGRMSTRPNDGDIIRCIDSGDKYYRYNKSSNQITYYPRISDEVLRQYNNYNGEEWKGTFKLYDCQQFNPSRPELNPDKPLNPDTAEGTSLICYKQNQNAIYRYSKDNDSIVHYPNQETAFTWNIKWYNYKLYDCSRIWNNNNGLNYNLITCKPSNGTIIKSSDDGKYYRYAENNNQLLLYETPAIAKQYSNFQSIQEQELNIETGKTNFTVNPTYDETTLPTYTFYFECCIEKTAGSWRNIMNHGINDTEGTDSRRPAVYITGTDVAPANRIRIVHSSDSDWNSGMISNFQANLGEWFTCCFIVNRSVMFTYFNDNKDATVMNGSNFNWGSKNKGDWFWNMHGPRTDGFIKVRNVRFWPFVMALEWPRTFNPIEFIDEINPYSLKATGNKIATTTLPPASNCKAYSKTRGLFTPTYSILPNTIKDGDTFKCGSGENQSLYRFNQERNKIFKYPTETIAASWDPNYSNYKAYNCGDYLQNTGTMELKPKDNDVVKCVHDNKSYRFINDTNKLEWYMTDNIIKQYNPSWLITDRLTRNCDQFKEDKTTFIPTQRVSVDTTSLKDGMALKCDNKPEIYRYNSRFNILMQYPSEIIGNSWDPTSYNGYYSYTCDNNYITNKGIMNERPKQNTVIKCNNVPGMLDNPFYYTYIFNDNSLKPRSSIESIKNAFPNWNVNNIQNNDCRQYYIREPRYYNGPNGTGEKRLIQPDDYEGCNPIPFTPTDVSTPSLIRDGENIILYTDSECNNIYMNDNGENGKDKPVNITYTPTNAFGDILKESNPSHYKLVTDDEYYTLYAKPLPSTI